MTLQERLKNVAVKAPLDYISEIVGPDLQDGCNLSDDENDELEKDNTDLQTTNTGMTLQSTKLVEIIVGIFSYPI